MLAAALLAFAVDAPTTGNGWVRIVDIKPSETSSCPGEFLYTVPSTGRAVCQRGPAGRTTNGDSNVKVPAGVAYTKVRAYALVRQ